MTREEEPGPLGHLPRSRPGRRSDKRPGEAAKAEPRPPTRPSRPAQQEDRVGDALKAAVNAAGAGVRIANGVTREILRRLPRR